MSLTHLQLQRVFKSLGLSLISLSISNPAFSTSNLMSILGDSTGSSSWAGSPPDPPVSCKLVLFFSAPPVTLLFLFIPVYGVTVLNVTSLNRYCKHQMYLLTCPLYLGTSINSFTSRNLHFPLTFPFWGPISLPFSPTLEPSYLVLAWLISPKVSTYYLAFCFICCQWSPFRTTGSVLSPSTKWW